MWNIIWPIIPGTNMYDKSDQETLTENNIITVARGRIKRFFSTIF